MRISPNSRLTPFKRIKFDKKGIKQFFLAIWKDKKKRVLSLAGIVVVILLAAFLLTRESTPVPVETIREVAVTRGDLVISQDGDGQAEFLTQSLSFGVSGEVTEVLIKAGDKVKAGTVIAKMDATDYEKALKDTQISYELAQIKYNSSKLSYEKSLYDAQQKVSALELDYMPMEQAPELFTEKEITTKKMDLESAIKNLENIKNDDSSVRQAQISVNQASTTLERAQEDLASVELKAPVDCTVLRVPLTVGMNVKVDEEAAVISRDIVYITSDVLEYDIGEIEVGQVIEVEFDALADRIYTGKVLEIDMVPTTNSGVTAYQVKSQLDKPDQKILPGMSCVVNFIFEQRKDVLIISNQAVKMVDGKQTVELYDENKKIVKREIKTGFSDGKNAEVVEGLEQGENILVRTITLPTTTSGTSSKSTQSTPALGVSGGSGIPATGGGGFGGGR